MQISIDVMKNLCQTGKCASPKKHQNIQKFNSKVKEEFLIFKELASRMALSSYVIFETFKKKFISILYEVLQCIES